MSKFSSLQKPNLAWRNFKSIADIHRLDKYQKELINYFLYEKVTKHQMALMLLEINRTESFIKSKYKQLEFKE